MAAYFHSVLLVVVAALLNYCATEDKAEFTYRITQTMKACTAEHKTNQEDLLDAVMKPEDFPKDAHNCAWSCIFKKMDLIDSNGKYVPDVAILNINRYSKGPKAEEGLAAAWRCVAVNDLPVSDGPTGCDRAKLVVDCLLKDLIAMKFK